MINEYSIIVFDDLHEYFCGRKIRETPLEAGMKNIPSGEYKDDKEGVWILRKKKPEKIISENTNEPSWYPSYLVTDPYTKKTIRAGMGSNNWTLIKEYTQKSKR